MNAGRFHVVMVDHKTGTHQIFNRPTLSYTECIAICQAMPPSTKGTQRLILKAHDDNPVDKQPGGHMRPVP